MIDTLPNGEHPTAQCVVETYRHVLRRIVEALRSGTKHAQWYFHTMDEDVDNGIAPALVRKGAKRWLQNQGTDVADEDEQPVQGNGEPEFLSNLGLAVTAEGIRIRVLRSDDGNLPVPGPSKARRAFYRQQLYLPGFEYNAPAIPSDVTHCVLHWDTDDEYNLSVVYLALPLGGENTRDSVQSSWNEIIWRRNAPSIHGTQVEAETIDQDIYLEGEQSGTA